MSERYHLEVKTSGGRETWIHSLYCWCSPPARQRQGPHEEAGTLGYFRWSALR